MRIYVYLIKSFTDCTQNLMLDVILLCSSKQMQPIASEGVVSQSQCFGDHQTGLIPTPLFL